MYIYVHTLVYIHKNAYIHTYIHTYIHKKCMHTYMYTYMFSVSGMNSDSRLGCVQHLRGVQGHVTVLPL